MENWRASSNPYDPPLEHPWFDPGTRNEGGGVQRQGDRLSLVFELTPNEFAESVLVAIVKDRYLRPLLLTAWLLVCASFFGWQVFKLWLEWKTRDPFAFHWLRLLQHSLVIAMVLAVPWIFYALVRNVLIWLVKLDQNRSLTTLRRLTISPSGYLVATQVESVNVRWSVVSAIVRTTNAILILRGHTGVDVVVPRRAFADGREADEFYETLMAFHAGARHPPNERR